MKSEKEGNQPGDNAIGQNDRASAEKHLNTEEAKAGITEGNSSKLYGEESMAHYRKWFYSLPPREQFIEGGVHHIVSLSEKLGYNYPPDIQQEIDRLCIGDRILQYCLQDIELYAEEERILKEDYGKLYDRLMQQGYRFGDETEDVGNSKKESEEQNETKI